MLERIIFWSWGFLTVSFQRTNEKPRYYEASEKRLAQIHDMLQVNGWVLDTHAPFYVIGAEVWINSKLNA